MRMGRNAGNAAIIIGMIICAACAAPAAIPARMMIATTERTANGAGSALWTASGAIPHSCAWIALLRMAGIAPNAMIAIAATMMSCALFVTDAMAAPAQSAMNAVCARNALPRKAMLSTALNAAHAL